MLEGKSFYLSRNLIEELNPLFVTGTSLLQRGLNLKSIELYLKEKNPSFNFLTTYLYSNSLGALFYNLKPLSSKELLNSELLFFVNNKENVFLRKNVFFKKSFISINWLNTHACDILNQKNHIQLLTKNIFEDNGTYINLEFRPQKTQAVFINKSSLSVKHFFIRLFESPIDSSKKHNEFLREILFYVNKFQYINKHTYINLTQKKEFLYTFTKKISLYPFKPQFNDFYVTNFFTTYSKNMVSASRELRSYNLNFDCL
jgi:NADH dehydrogenase/NADH:ubiquinone oxidoreductase subunit G